MPPTAPAGHVLTRVGFWIWLGAWLGTIALFSATARAAFRVVPNPEIAGQLVGELLHPLLAFGAVSGVALAGLAARLRRGAFTIVLPLVLTTACLVNQFGVTRAVAEIRLTDPGLAPEMAARFAALHRLSVWLFIGVGVGVLILAAAHVRAELREARGSAPTSAPHA